MRSRIGESALYVPVLCRHCDDPPCVETCPEGVFYRRQDGVVLMDSSLCTACEICIEACPYDALRLNEARGVVEKCDLCAERLERGLLPNCVQHCFAQVFIL